MKCLPCGESGGLYALTTVMPSLEERVKLKMCQRFVMKVVVSCPHPAPSFPYSRQCFSSLNRSIWSCTTNFSGTILSRPDHRRLLGNRVQIGDWSRNATPCSSPAHHSPACCPCSPCPEMLPSHLLPILQTLSWPISITATYPFLWACCDTGRQAKCISVCLPKIPQSSSALSYFYPFLRVAPSIGQSY